MRDLREIFHAYGFEVFEGPEIETEEYNFELLNIPPDHPARDLWDTLYVAEPGSVEAGAAAAEDGTILRTHTSPVQIRAMRALDAADPGHHAGPLLPLRGRRRQPQLRVLPDRGRWSIDRDTTPGRSQGAAGGGRPRPLRAATSARGSVPATTRSPSRASRSTSAAWCAAARAARPASARGWMTILGAGMVHPDRHSQRRLRPGRVPGLRRSAWARTG